MTGLGDLIPDHLWALLAQADAAPSGIESMFRNPVIPMIFLGILFYIMLIRPESQKKAQHAKLVENLKKHDRVVTIGGIYGTVSNVQKNSPDVTLVIDENSNTKVRIQRHSISRVIIDKDADE